MSVDKITNAPTQNQVISKINEVIDNLGTATGANIDLSNLSATGEAKFQAPLVSGTNIKTINNTSILGSGDLSVGGLPTQTGHAGEFLTTDGTDASWGKVPTRNIGEVVTSTLPLTDAGLHLLDGSLLAYGSYQDFIDYIAGLYNSGSYSAIFTTESAWQTAVTNYGVCGKFVYNSTNNTVRLPKYGQELFSTNNISTSKTLGVRGNGMALGLTNGSSNAGLANTATYGMVSNIASYGANVGASATAGNFTSLTAGITQDATYSGMVAELPAITNQYGLNCYYYIVIATTTKTSIEVDIDEIATDLNGKADVDLSNINASSSAKNAITTWMLPDLTSGIEVTWNTNYSCPSNGWVYITGNSQNSNYVYLNINSTSFRVACFAANSVGMAALFAPVSQGDVVKGTGGTNTQHIYFYPMKGAN